MSWKDLVLALVPGLCLIHHGRPGRGVLWFFLFVLLLNGFFITPFLVTSDLVRMGAVLGAGVTWLLAAGDGIRCAAGTRRGRVAAEAREGEPVEAGR